MVLRRMLGELDEDMEATKAHMTQVQRMTQELIRRSGRCGVLTVMLCSTS